jgi:integrase
VDRLTHPRRKARVPAGPTWDTVKVLLHQCSLRERAILALMAYGGLRRGEVAALDVGDLESGKMGLARDMFGAD